MAKKATVLKNSSLIESKRESDTLRLWESYRDQASLWRALTLLQLPATAMACGLAVTLWQTRSITLNVPPRPLPGVYAAQEIPNSEFADAATDFINLIATYQPAVAKRQFTRAREMTIEPLTTRFTTEMLQNELRAIESTNRTQIYYADPTRLEVVRGGPNNDVYVKMVGERVKYVSGREIPSETTRYVVTLTTLPRSPLNPYGIVISNVASEDLKPGEAGTLDF